MNDFLIGVMASVVTAILIALFKNQLSTLLSALFAKLYPTVRGRYRINWIDMGKSRKEKDLIEFHQFGRIVWGVLENHVGDQIVAKQKVRGHVSPARILTFTYESSTPEHHHYGSGLLKMSPGSKYKIAGYVTFICKTCEATASQRVVLEKLE